MATSIKDVAERAGVSVATVSYVLNGKKHITDKTKARVLKAIEETGYVPNTVARSLKMHKSNMIAFIVPDISSPYFSLMAKAIEKTLRENGYQLILCNSDEDGELEKQQILQLKSQYICGYILAPVNRAFDYRSILPDNRYPLIMVDRQTDFIQADTVLGDDAEAIGRVISDLAERGHKKIGYIAGVPDISTTNERLSIFTTCLQKNGLPIDRDLIRYGDTTVEKGYQLMSQLLENQEMTAVFVSNSSMTIGALNCLAEREIRIPEQLSVVGYDYYWASIMNPPLTTISEDVRAMGEYTAARLIELIEGKNKNVYQEVRIPAKLTVRKSY